MNSIPNILHQIWVGPKMMPLGWMETWRDKNPHMEYVLWDNYKGFLYENKIRDFINEGRYAIAADIMRVEILYNEGGVYVDADSICLEPIEDAPFMGSDFFAAHDYTAWVANGVIGCTPHHPILRDYMDKIQDYDEYWEFGARLFDTCIPKGSLILPTCTFYPTSQKGKKAPLEGKIYADQIWATTRGKYATADLHR